jgi:hypothetical protein
MGKNLLQELKELFGVEAGHDLNPIVFRLIEQKVRSKFFFNINENQVKKILENVPDIFPENGKIKGYHRGLYRQKRVYREIGAAGDNPFTTEVKTEVITEVINLGVEIKTGIDKNFSDDEFCRKENKPASALVS